MSSWDVCPRIVTTDGLSGERVDGFVEAALWPVASMLLLMPQRRPADPDDTRPI